MKRQHVNLIAATLTALGLAGCFDDPTSSLRNGPVVVDLDKTAVTITAGDSIIVEARIRDEQGNLLPVTGTTWASDDQTTAAVNSAALQLPADGSSRAYVLGVKAIGGITWVRATGRGVTDSLRVTVLPASLAPVGNAATVGTLRADTASGSAFSARDTLVVTMTDPGLLFDTTTGAGSRLGLAGSRPYVLSRTTTEIKAVARGPHHGPIAVTNVRFLGNAGTGEVIIDSLFTETDSVAAPRFLGTVAVSGDTVIATAPASMTFGAATGVKLGEFAGTIFRRTGTVGGTVRAVFDSTATRGATVTSVTSGLAFDSLKYNGAFAINAARFPGTVTQLGTGRLLDTVIAVATAPATFTATANLSLSGDNMWVVRRTADSLYMIPRQSGGGRVTVSATVVATDTIPNRQTQADTYSVNGAVTGEANEPGNDAPAGATVIATPARGASAATAVPVLVHGALDGTDIDDLYSFTMPDSARIRVTLRHVGSTGGTACTVIGTPDIDVLLSTGGFSGFIDGFGGATCANPEVATSTALRGPGTYFIYANMWDTHSSPRPHDTYRLEVIRYYP